MSFRNISVHHKSIYPLHKTLEKLAYKEKGYKYTGLSFKKVSSLVQEDKTSHEIAIIHGKIKVHVLKK